MRLKRDEIFQMLAEVRDELAGWKFPPDGERLPEDLNDLPPYDAIEATEEILRVLKGEKVLYK